MHRSSAPGLHVLLALAAVSLAGAKPNVVLILIDDLGWGDFSCFGNAEARTPNIDALAAEGIAFEQFYVNSPICSPSRTAISTGQYPQRWRISSYLDNRAENARRGVADWLDPAAPMLARELRAAGYATGHFGKWHMGGQRDVGDAPLPAQYGFDESLANFEGLGPRVLPLACKPGGVSPARHDLGSRNLGRGPVLWRDRARVTGDFAEAALAFAKAAAARGVPFYVNLWPDDVHAPMHPPLDRWGDGGKRTLYLAVLEEMDAQLGLFLDHLRGDAALRENTLVLACSDNGPEPGFGSAGPLRGHKATLYEGGVRSPLIAWAPGLMPQQAQGMRNVESVFAAIDLAPSVLAICGVEGPEGIAFDGEEVSGVLLGKSRESRERPIFFRRPPDREHFRHYADLPDLAVREGKWKLYCDYDGSRAQLHDLASDPSEEKDVAAANPAITARLVGELVAWHKSLPPDNGPALGSAANATQRK